MYEGDDFSNLEEETPRKNPEIKHSCFGPEFSAGSFCCPSPAWLDTLS